MDKEIRVTVTGGSGFIASHCIIQLLNEGYNVTATLRSLSREKELRNIIKENVIKQEEGAHKSNHKKESSFVDKQLNFVEANLSSDENWDEAIKGSTYVLHVASPFFTTLPKNAEEELYKPARDGALRVLSAASRQKVQRVVMTSSMAAISYGHSGIKQSALLDEGTWTDITGGDVTPYIISKTIAEKAAWDFINTDKSGLELVSINPSVVLGPVLEKDFGSSAQIIRKLMNREVPGLPRIGFQIIDVRDVAKAHVKAMVMPDAKGKRIALTDRFLWFKEIAEILQEEFGTKGVKVPQRTIPDFFVRMFALVDKETKSVLNELGIQRELSNERMKNFLGITPIPAREAILETARTLIAHGLVKS